MAEISDISLIQTHDWIPSAFPVMNAEQAKEA